LNLWPRNVDQCVTSHRIPFEQDFKEEIEGPAWKVGQASEEMQIPQRDLLFLGWNSKSPMGRPCARVRERRTKGCRWSGEWKRIFTVLPVKG